MSVILEAKEGDELQVAAWRWRPTVSLLARAGVLPAGERTERCMAGGCGGFITAEEAAHAATQVAEVLKSLAPGERVLFDGQRTTAPRDRSKPAAEWTDDDARLVYSMDRDWLERFLAFCQRSGGFKVI
jgi:hypothetical protein